MFSRFVGQSAALRIAGKRLDEYFLRIPEQVPDAARDPLERVFRFSRTRRLVVTEEGRLGLGPVAAKRGDVMCVLLGCSVPMVLRPCGAEEYRIVGVAYVHGIMEGEVIEWLGRGERRFEAIAIC